MGRYRKKPVVIEAHKWEGDNWPDFLQFIVARGGEASTEGDSLYIHTLEGVMEASAGDWIIQGVQGEFYPCKPDIFDATYEEVIG
jgi:hypothetical protein